MIYLLAPFLLAYTLWVFFLAVMSLYRAREAGKLSTAAKTLGMPILYVGYLLDFLANVLILTLVMLELPKEFLVSPRVARLQASGKGYRKTLATWVCSKLLDPFDPSGCHCK